MNNVIWSTHNSLTIEHAKACFQSLLRDQTDDYRWDNFIVYNTHPDELPNSTIVELLNSYNERGFIQNIIVYPYDQTSLKTLIVDVKNQLQYAVDSGLHTTTGWTLLLKSEYRLSHNFNEVLNQNTGETKKQWGLPIYNAKADITWNQGIINRRLSLPKWVPNDFESFCDRNEPLPETYPLVPVPAPYSHGVGDLNNIYNRSVNFISCWSPLDYNVHVFTNDVLTIANDAAKNSMDRDETSHGGAEGLFIKMRSNGVPLLSEARAYAVHLFHDITFRNQRGY